MSLLLVVCLLGIGGGTAESIRSLTTRGCYCPCSMSLLLVVCLLGIGGGTAESIRSLTTRGCYCPCSMSLLLVVCLLGIGGGEFGESLSTVVPAVSTAERVDGILDINSRLIQTDDLLEGDILKPKSFSAFSPRTLQWPKLNGVVTIPYVLSADYEPDHRKIIQDAFNDLESATCLRFVPRTNQRDFLSIEPDFGCYSGVGRTGKKQVVSLSFECLKKGKGVVLHELMHVAGFWHEHSRADRDLYIDVQWKSIMSGYERNFCKFETTNMLVDYAYDSILHYSSKAFSKDGSSTILIRGDHPGTEIGQRVKLSVSDTLRINKYYYCPQYAPSPGDHEILSRDSPEVAYECPQASLNKEVKPTAGAFSKTAPATIRTFTNRSDLSSTRQLSTLSPAPPFFYAEISKFQTTLNGESQERHLFNILSVPVLNSKTTQPISETSSPKLSNGEPTPWSATSMAVSTVPDHQLRVGDVRNASLGVVTGFVITGDLEEPTTINQPDKSVSGSSNERLEKHSTIALMGLQEEIPITEATIDFIQETTKSALEKQKYSFTSAAPSTQSTDQLPTKTPVILVSNAPVTSPATAPELQQSSTKDEWIAPIKSSTYVSSIQEEKESTENTTAQGTILTRNMSAIAAVVPTIAHLLTVISQTSGLVPRGTVQNLDIKDTPTQTLAGLQSTLASKQTTSEDRLKSSAHVDAFNYVGDSDYANQNFKELGKRSLPEPLRPSESGESYGSRSGRYERWIHANLQTHSHSNKRKVVGNKNKQSRSAVHNLFSQKTSSVSPPTIHEIIRRMPNLERSSKVETNSEPVCGFERGLCGWKQSSNDDFYWSLSWGSVNPYTGYFKPGGFHLSLKSSPKDVSTEQKALLLSPIIQPFSCLSFWYGSRHSIMGTLNVYILSSTGEKTPLWSTGGQSNVGWTKAQLKLPPHPHPHDLRVVVEGKRSPSNESNIVIDNLFVGKCN